MKEWKKPCLLVFDQESVLERIMANARSGGGGCGCWAVAQIVYC